MKMKNIFTFLLLYVLVWKTSLHAQQSFNISFIHDSITVNGTFTTPNGSGNFPVIIINAGSGANDRDGTLPMLGGNVACLYPSLLNDTLFPYKELSEALVDSGYAVLRYDKLEFTYSPSSLGTITFRKLWLPVESAIDYVKTRTDVDTNRIILLGHSEGSSLIPYIAKTRTDVRALISLAGARTPFDSLLAYQLVYIAQTCGGNVPQAQAQAGQILAYFNIIRTNTWNAGTPDLFGVPASAWYDYVLATDAVSGNYNLCNLPTLFTGLGLDINVPPAELIRFQNEVTVTNDFWSLPGLIHYMTPNNSPHVSKALTDTIIYWLRRSNIATGIKNNSEDEFTLETYPNPFYNNVTIEINKPIIKKLTISIYNSLGQVVFQKTENNIQNAFINTIELDKLPIGLYFLVTETDGIINVKKLSKSKL
jgi:dienelactone hydrolase